MGFEWILQYLPQFVNLLKRNPLKVEQDWGRGTEKNAQRERDKKKKREIWGYRKQGVKDKKGKRKLQ